jgi:SAM-dependent methyltransferase
MTDTSLFSTTTWTGLAATSWDSLGGNEPQDDYGYLLDLLRRRGGTALDVGCGTGRLLVRFLQEELDVHGVDTSEDMLDLCRTKAERRGLAPTLFLQGMEELDLPVRYRTVFVACGSFMLLLDDEQALTALRSMRGQLAEDGLLFLNFFGPSNPPQPVFDRWELRRTGTLPDGIEVSMEILTREHDLATNVVRGRRRYTCRKAGQVLGAEYLEDVYRWYAPHQVSELLAAAGFRDVTVYGDYAGNPLGEQSEVAVFLARA